MWGNKQLLYETFYLIQKLIDLMSCFFLEKFLVHRTLHVGYSMWPLIPPSDFYHSLPLELSCKDGNKTFSLSAKTRQ